MHACMFTDLSLKGNRIMRTMYTRPSLLRVALSVPVPLRLSHTDMLLKGESPPPHPHTQLGIAVIGSGISQTSDTTVEPQNLFKNRDAFQETTGGKTHEVLFTSKSSESRNSRPKVFLTRRLSRQSRSFPFSVLKGTC